MNTDKKLLRRSFISLIEKVGRALTAQEMVEIGEDAGFWNDMDAEMLHSGRVQLVRTWLRETKDKNGLRKWEYLEVIDAEGNTKPMYQQRALFEIADYQQVISRRLKNLDEDKQVIIKLAIELYQRHGVQASLPFDVNFSEAVDAVA